MICLFVVWHSQAIQCKLLAEAMLTLKTAMEKTVAS